MRAATLRCPQVSFEELDFIINQLRISRPNYDLSLYKRSYFIDDFLCSEENSKCNFKCWNYFVCFDYPLDC